MEDNQQGVGPSFRRLKTRIQDTLKRYKPAIPLVLVALLSFTGILLNRRAITERIILNAEDVEDIAAMTMATATAPPAVSAQIYQAILPSVVIVQAQYDVETEPRRLLGGGVIVNEDGLILTSLHVVAEAIEVLYQGSLDDHYEQLAPAGGALVDAVAKHCDRSLLASRRA